MPPSFLQAQYAQVRQLYPAWLYPPCWHQQTFALGGNWLGGWCPAPLCCVGELGPMKSGRRHSGGAFHFHLFTHPSTHLFNHFWGTISMIQAPVWHWRQTRIKENPHGSCTQGPIPPYWTQTPPFESIRMVTLAHFLALWLLWGHGIDTPWEELWPFVEYRCGQEPLALGRKRGKWQRWVTQSKENMTRSGYLGFRALSLCVPGVPQSSVSSSKQSRGDLNQCLLNFPPLNIHLYYPPNVHILKNCVYPDLLHTLKSSH